MSVDARIRERCAALLRSDAAACILVGTAGGRVLGLASLHITPVIHRPTGIGRMTALAVLSEAQGMGTGRRLIAEAERHFAAAGPPPRGGDERSAPPLRLWFLSSPRL